MEEKKDLGVAAEDSGRSTPAVGETPNLRLRPNAILDWASRLEQWFNSHADRGTRTYWLILIAANLIIAVVMPTGAYLILH